MNDCKHENKAWSSMVLYSAPAQQDWVCRDCLMIGRDRLGTWREPIPPHNGSDDYKELRGDVEAARVFWAGVDWLAHKKGESER